MSEAERALHFVNQEQSRNGISTCNLALYYRPHIVRQALTLLRRDLSAHIFFLFTTEARFDSRRFPFKHVPILELSNNNILVRVRYKPAREWLLANNPSWLEEILPRFPPRTAIHAIVFDYPGYCLDPWDLTELTIDAREVGRIQLKPTAEL